MEMAGLPRLILKLSNVKAEVAWVLVGQAMVFAGGLIGVKLLTNAMPQEAYGELALGMSIAGLINMFLFGPLGQIILRYYSVSKDRGEQAAYYSLLRQLHVWSLIILAVGGVAIALAIDVIAGIGWAWLMAAAMVFGVVSGLLGSVQGLFTAARERRLAALSQSADVWLRYAMALLLLYLGGREGYWALVGYALGSLVILLFQIRHVRRMISGANGSDSVRADVLTRYRDEFWRFGAPFVAFAGLGAVSQYADRWLLQGLAGKVEVGVYAALYQIASAPIGLLAGIVTQLVVPVVFARAGALTQKVQIEHSRNLLNLTLLIVAGAFAIAVIVAVLWGEVIVTWLANPSFARHGNILWMLVLGLALFHLAQLMVAEGLSKNLSRRYFWPKLAQGLTLLVAGYVLVAAYGLWGMAVALLLSSLVYCALVMQVNTLLRRESAAIISRVG